MCACESVPEGIASRSRKRREERKKKKKKETFKVKGTSTLIPKMGQKFLVGEEGGVVR